MNGYEQLTLSWWRPLSYRNQSIDLLRKSVDWFLYDNGPRHERVNLERIVRFSEQCYRTLLCNFYKLLIDVFSQFRNQNIIFLLFVNSRVLQNQLIITCYGTTTNWMQIKFKRWHTTCATYIHDVKEVLVILHRHIMPIWRLLEQENTIMLWLRTPQTKSLMKWNKNI